MVLQDSRGLLPVYYTNSRARLNLNRDGPYIMMDESLEPGSSLRTNNEPPTISRILPDYARSISEMPIVEPLSPRPAVAIANSIKSLSPATMKKAPGEIDKLEGFLTWFDLYRKFFALALGLNVAALVTTTMGKFSYAKTNVYAFALGNLAASILARNELVLRILYWLVVRTLFWAPIRIRNCLTAGFVNLGGVHSGCATSGLIWSVYAAYVCFSAHEYPKAILGFTILIPLALVTSILVALPQIRHKHHDVFERFHRFVGWLGLAYLWILIILIQSWDPIQKEYRLGIVKWYKVQEFWLSIGLSAMLLAPWLTLQKIPVKVTVPSSKTAFLSFPGGCYTGLLGRVSRSPWLEWHAFGIISEGPMAFTHHMLVVAQGDWTRALISNPPTHLWTRNLKFAGLPYLAELYERGVIVATGAGIGVTLSVYLQTKGYFHLIWIGSDIANTYGSDIMDLIHKAVKGDRMTVVDTKKLGRPDLVQMIDEVYRKIAAQVVFITSNPKGTELMVNGCRERGMTAFGPLFDS